MIARSFACIAGFVVLSLLSSLASAEIYKCRDANGRASFSQTPCPASVVTGDTEAHKLWREMRVMVNQGQSIYKKLGPDVSAIIECKNSAKAYALKLDEYDQRLQTVSEHKHPALFEAQRYLRECGQCRASAMQYCKRADTELDKEMNVLLPPVARK